MQHRNSKTMLQRLLLIALLVVFAITPLVAQTQAELDEAAEKVGVLFKQQKFTEALPYAEKLVKAYPDDADLQFIYGFCLLGKSKNTADKEEARQLVVKARQAFVRAKQLGSKENILDALIASIPEDGVVGGKFSKNEEAENAMNEAEAFFSQGKMDEALAAYQKAFKLDPKIYEAALFSGDVYTQKGDYENAEVWYKTAIIIDPNRETAYRYSATPLMKQKKIEQARDRYIEAYIVEPYSRFAISGLTQWGQATGTRLGHPRIDVPEITIGPDGKSKSTINVNPLADDGSMAWAMYVATREIWRKEKFAKTFPNEKAYRHSLPEEAEALREVIRMVQSQKARIKKLDPQLETLIKLDQDGVLEAYILMAMPDKGIAQDHAEYLAKNRDKLRQYVLKYVIGAGN
ncbi:MAG: tetratricopeptide repeat protein [Acidobacteria bacterium]|nr:tetratricopeptide repeat protein [Acidobacteriota bacterium]